MAKVLESLMAILEPQSEGARALDLFAGTGAVGLALLEQGATQVTFVEGDARVASTLRRKLKESGQASRCQLVTGRVPQVLSKLTERFTLLLADPPYDWPETASLLPALQRLAEPDAILVVEHHHKTVYPEAAGWVMYRQQKYGETRLSFFRLLVDPADEPGHHGGQSEKDGDRTRVLGVQVDQMHADHSDT
jgi:16S rRNA (guanine966-N2)-methyltransferase